ncbi:MAG TPA: trypsin-like peptidase domain-containing protein [Polyangiaceae bacterium]
MQSTRFRLVRVFAVASILALPSLAFAQQAGKVAPPKPPPSSAAVQASKAEASRISDAIVDVADKVSPSVVQVDVTTRDEGSDRLQRWLGRSGDSPIARGLGSGVIYTADGAILTNNHVVDEALTINVHLRDGRFLPAKLVGRDPATDLAVIKIDATGLTAAKFADTDKLRVGQSVVAIGSPLGLDYSVTSGILSAKGRGGLGMNAIEDYLQTDASINPGNSGGPLCNLDGEVVGINDMIARGEGGGIGFAIPSNLAHHVADQILKNGHVERAWIGVGIQDLTPDLAAAMKMEPNGGVLVNNVVANGPAAKSQIHAGDVIASVGGKAVRDSHELQREIMAHDVGQNVQLEIVRQGKHYGTPVALLARPGQQPAPLPVQQQGVPQAGLGLSVRDISAQQAQQLGLTAKPLPLVTAVVPGSAADRAGLKQGDVVVEVDGIQDPNSLQVQQQAADGQILLRLRRGESAFYAALKK